MLGDGVDRLFCNVLVVGNIERQQRVAVLHESDQAGIGQVTTVCKSQTLDTSTDRKRHYTAIVDLVGESGKVQALNEIAVSKGWVLHAQGLADAGMVLPICASGTVP